MKVGKLSKAQLDFIVDSLQSNPGMSSEEYDCLRKNHPYAIMREDNVLILSSMKHYSLKDEQLTNFFLSYFGNPTYSLDFFYELIYNVGDYTNPHYDKRVAVQTTLILLSDNFTGGELTIDDKSVEFKEKGSYISFDGYRQKHSVSEVTSGQRRVLVVMYNKINQMI